ncbi:restriction endonuclease subunit S [Tsukamurella spumae]|uniref:Restriction endonuclease subunit S n=1 Tax=Tsukamurella spumae TaxID=44753 RepID=A0A846X9B1_9ACTN|nr:restriction endonuclease subunit S [Tsukamurella spumae]NKY21016.1 restriction endonuclease subunit S [Tsukamurella spumae]
MTRTVGDLIYEFRAVPEVGQDPPVLTLTEKNGFVYQADRFNKRLATEDTSSYKLIGRDDFAFNPYLLWAGAIARNTLADCGVISPLYPTFRVREGFDPSYVGKLLLSARMVSAYDSIAFGSVPRRRRSSVGDFLGLAVPSVPILDEQRRIAAILDHADKQRGDSLRVVAELAQVSARMFDERFGACSGQLVQLSDIASVSSGITKGRRTDRAVRPVPYLAVANVQDGRLDLGKIKTIDATEVEIEKYKLRRGDLVLTEGGDPDKLGRGTVWQEEIGECIHQNHIFKVRVSDRDAVSPAYLSALIASRSSKKYFMKSAKQTTGIASINMTQLKALPVCVPAIQEQRAYERDVDAISRVLSTAKSAADLHGELLESLQARAFRGEL